MFLKFIRNIDTLKLNLSKNNKYLYAESPVKEGRKKVCCYSAVIFLV